MALDDTFVRRVELVSPDSFGEEQSTLDIHQVTVGDVGLVVWDAAIVLSHVLARSEAFKSVPWGEKFVVELGSGTGLAGLVTALLGCDVILTDLPLCIPLMERNIAVNKAKLRGSVKAAVLEWGCDVPKFKEDACSGRAVDLLLLADVIYYEASLEPLLNTMLCLSSENTQILMCYEDRFTGNKQQLKAQFFARASRDFLVEELPREIVPQEFQCPEIHIVAMKRKDG